jgi:TatD DNase family protein
MLQDGHAHLQSVTDKEGMCRILAALSENKVGRIFCNATSPEDWESVSGFASKYKEVIPFYGIHPWFADKLEDGWHKRLVTYLEKPPSGIGEIGLDRAKETEIGFEIQREVFEKQLSIAFVLNKSFTLHCVDAWGAVIESLKVRRAGKLPFIVHSFSGSKEVLADIIKLGGYVSFSLKLVEKRYKKISEAFLAAPLERLLLETDFPYAPGAVSKVPARPEDYPDCVKRLYEIAARLKGVEAGKLEKAVWENGTVFLH